MSWAPLILVLGLIVLGAAMAVSLIRSGHAGWGWALIAAMGALIAAILWLMRLGRSDSSSGDSYSGGSGGGGGATGSW